MKSAKEICRAIEDKVVTYGWWRVKSDIEKLLIDYGNDIREDQRRIDAITYSNPEKLIGFDYEQNTENAGKSPEGEEKTND